MKRFDRVRLWDTMLVILSLALAAYLLHRFGIRGFGDYGCDRAPGLCAR